MIAFPMILTPTGQSMVTQVMTHPAVYLDTWALRKFAENDHLGERFRNAIMRRGGTLMLSYVSIGEFTSFDEPRYARSVGPFVDSLVPNLFFSRFDPFQVIPDEVLVAAGRRDGTPAGDELLLKRYAMRRTGVAHPSIAQWFENMHADRAILSGPVQAMANRLLSSIATLRAQLTTDRAFARMARKAIKASTLPRATQALMQALIYRLDPKMVLDATDALDIAHFVVPAAYADFVLLDYRWHMRLVDTRQYLRSIKIETRIAELYSEPGDGVLKFLDRLEAWPSKDKTAA